MRLRELHKALFSSFLVLTPIYKSAEGMAVGSTIDEGARVVAARKQHFSNEELLVAILTSIEQNKRVQSSSLSPVNRTDESSPEEEEKLKSEEPAVHVSPRGISIASLLECAKEIFESPALEQWLEKLPLKEMMPYVMKTTPAGFLDEILNCLSSGKDIDPAYIQALCRSVARMDLDENTGIPSALREIRESMPEKEVSYFIRNAPLEIIKIAREMGAQLQEEKEAEEKEMAESKTTEEISEKTAFVTRIIETHNFLNGKNEDLVYASLLKLIKSALLKIKADGKEHISGEALRQEVEDKYSLFPQQSLQQALISYAFMPAIIKEEYELAVDYEISDIVSYQFRIAVAAHYKDWLALAYLQDIFYRLYVHAKGYIPEERNESLFKEAFIISDAIQRYLEDQLHQDIQEPYDYYALGLTAENVSFKNHFAKAKFFYEKVPAESRLNIKAQFRKVLHAKKRREALEEFVKKNKDHTLAQIKLAIQQAPSEREEFLKDITKATRDEILKGKALTQAGVLVGNKRRYEDSLEYYDEAVKTGYLPANYKAYDCVKRQRVPFSEEKKAQVLESYTEAYLKLGHLKAASMLPHKDIHAYIPWFVWSESIKAYKFNEQKFIDHLETLINFYKGESA